MLKLQAQFKSLPPVEPEESILFRVLTQTLVSVGILATAIAAESYDSLWAIPVSMMGATWSWYGRRKRNIGLKFLIATAMLIVLALFFNRMLLGGQLNDTRLILAEFLIQVQVLHSFDLPRRKDLGYSMMIGLVLLGVASTLSQTMWFGALLMLFFAIALPVLMLDYRSRLGLSTAKLAASFKKMTFSALPLIFVITLVLGLLLFVFMPRLPGYQLRSFPMSARIQTQQNFNNQAITNPGYVRGGKGGSSAPGQGQADDEKFSEDDYYGFNNKINQNLRGNLKPRVVMRVRSQAEGFWRVMAFDRYTGQGWEMSRNDKTQTIKRPEWAYRFILPSPVTLNKTKEVIQTYTIVSDLPNLIPAMAQPKELYFPTDQVAVDPENGLRSPVGLTEGLTYSVISEVPYRDRTVLQKASTFLEPPKNSPYLQLPPKPDKIRKLTQQAIATSPKELTSTYETTLYLAQYLKQRYQIQPDIPKLARDEDLVEAFLFKYKGGYPDHFATTLTIMLRSVGIPARLVAGFEPGKFNPFTGLYEVSNTDAHAMTEINIPKFGWFAVNPIPGYPLVPPSIEDDKTFSVVEQFWKWVAGWLPSPVAGIFGGLMGAIAWLIGLFSQGWVGIFTGLILLTVFGFLGWLGLKGWRKWRYQRWLKRQPPMARLYQQMLDWLATQGHRKHPAQTPLEYAQQALATQEKPQAIAIQEISQAYLDWRYGQVPPDLELLRQTLRAMKASKR
jgi:transglutaminase-like putative cysteine protease